MRDNAIFFPYINVPSNAWFFRVLLYWDKVSSIIPYDHIFNPDLLTPYMRDLVVAELVEQISPGGYIHNIPHFEEAFLNYICNQINFKKYRRHKNLLLKNPFSIHIEKMGNIAEELIDLGLAKHDHYPWFLVEDWVANAFMCYLATSLGNLGEINASPVTNNLENSKLLRINKNFILTKERKYVRRRNNVRDVILNNILPGPIELPPIDDLINFKLSYGNKLSELRNTIEGYCIDLANIRNNEERNERVQILNKTIENDVQEISKIMESSWKRITFGTLMPILGVGAEILQQNALQNPISITLAGFSATNAVYQAFKGVEDYNNILNRPLAYVALAKEAFN